MGCSVNCSKMPLRPHATVLAVSFNVSHHGTFTGVSGACLVSELPFACLLKLHCQRHMEDQGESGRIDRLEAKTLPGALPSTERVFRHSFAGMTVLGNFAA